MASSETSQLSVPPLEPLVLRRRLYWLAWASVIVPPVAGNAVLLFAKVFPFPEWIFLFTDAGGLVMVTFVIIALATVPPVYRLIVGLPDRPPDEAARIVGRIRRIAPWALLGFVVVYSVVGLFSADLALRRLGLVLQPISEVPLLALSPIPVAVITAFPIYFVFCDTLGRYLAPRGVVANLLPLRYRLIILGTATPFFVDCFLVGYFYSRTGEISAETFGVWLTLLVLATVGTLFGERGMRQSMEPLETYLRGRGKTDAPLTPATLDELGELTSLMSQLVEERGTALSELRSVQRNARLGLWRLTRDGDLQCSEEARRILGVDPDVALARIADLAALFEPADADFLTRSVSARANAAQPFKRTIKIRSAAQDDATILFSGVPRIGSPDDPPSWAGFIQDVSESVAKERQLQAALKLESVGKLSGGAAHDFNNLLAVILGNMELLRDDETDPERLEMIDNSIEATKRGSELTRAMLSFARQSTLQTSEIDLNDTVRKLKNWLARTLPAHVDVETSLLAGLWPVNVDPGLTENAILNLILNARDAMLDGGRLTIETANVRIDNDYLRSRKEDMEPGRYVMLAVSDTGTGIEDKDLVRIFEPFFSRKPVGQGSGMGLSMVQGFMRQSGGTIRVYSEVGVGTTFKLYFKAEEKTSGRDEATVRDAPWAPMDGENRKVMLVEDEEGVLSALRKMIELAGYSVTPAASGDIAYALFLDDPSIDLVVTDIVMPGKLMGTGLAKKLRELRADLPVIFMSGYASEATVHGNGLRSTDIRLMKPVSRRDLIAAIEQSLE